MLHSIDSASFDAKKWTRFSHDALGLLLGFVGVCVFAGTLPFTHIAVEHLSPLFVTTGRAALAGLLALGNTAHLGRP